MRRRRVAIQGELGSNSHMAAMRMMPGVVAGPEEGAEREFVIVPCALSAEVIERLAGGEVECAVLPIENSLHGSVAEHYDLLLEHAVRITGEGMLRIQHNVVAAPGVRLEDVRRVLSHPVALSQCRRWLRGHPGIEAVPFYDTAGAVKEIVGRGLRDAAALAPKLAAEVYGAEVLEWGVEDHVENYTRFFTLERDRGEGAAGGAQDTAGNKMSVAFRLPHRPGTLMAALEGFSRGGMNLTRIESRPVPGRPWEYVFYADVRFEGGAQADEGLRQLRGLCAEVKELGRYRIAGGS